jgi:non-heme chloroperoxidase
MKPKVKDHALRKAASLGVIGVGALVASAPARWQRAADPTDGKPLYLPQGEELEVARPDGAVLAVWDSGPPACPAAVLVHGWTADRRVWAATARRLVATGERVVVYDQRGHGRSTRGASALSVETLGDDLAAVLEHLDIHAAALVGHSMGGMAVQQFAIAHPDALARRVSAVVLVSTAASGVVPRGPYRGYARTMASSRAVQRAMGNPRIGPWLVRSTAGRRVSLAHLEATLETFLATPLDVRAGYLESMAQLDLRSDLPSLSVPVVVVCGTRDALTPLRKSREIASLVSGARLRVVRGAGHQLVFEHPEVLAEVIGELASSARSPVQSSRKTMPVRGLGQK